MFLKKLNEFNLDKDKFNLCFKDNKLFWENIKLRKVSDLLYIYHPKYNNVLIEALKNLKIWIVIGQGISFIII